MNLGIEGRRAAVAAASRGLGYAVAAALGAEGVQVAMCSRSREAIEHAARRIGPNAVPLVADVSAPASAAAFVEAARAELGGVDILVTNGGGPPAGTFSTTSLDQYVAAFESNCLSVIGMCEAAVPAMQARGWGRVVAITSLAVRQPIPTLILSNTARAGVTGFLKTLAREVAAAGVTVNSMQPGLHDTERIRDLRGDDASGAAAGVPAGTLGEPAGFGALAAFLCSEQAGYITGAAIPVDGGAHAGLL